MMEFGSLVLRRFFDGSSTVLCLCVLCVLHVPHHDPGVMDLGYCIGLDLVTLKIVMHMIKWHATLADQSHQI